MITGVCTDTRRIRHGDVFFALIADRDGHAFVPEAARAGAAAVVVSRNVDVALPTVRVPDTLVALGNLARLYRLQEFPSLSVVAVTGSVGKTTTKEMVAAVLGARYRILKNAANLNNEIGLPLSLFQLSPEHDVAILEMAMRAPGEIGRLADIARPAIGVITNVGLSHMERLGSVEAIAGAKAELLEALSPEGLAVLNADDQYYEFLRRQRIGRMMSFGARESCGVRAVDIRIHRDGRAGASITTPKGDIELDLAIVGQHNIWNAMAAIAVGIEMGISPEDARTALEVFASPAKRLDLHHSPNGYAVLDDTYNASPASMISALLALSSMQGSRRIAVLGDMLELGDSAEAAHREVGWAVAGEEIDHLVTVGELGRLIADGAVQHGFPVYRTSSYDSSSEVAGQLKNSLGADDVVLVKGSRALAMEIVVEGLLSD